MDDWADVCAGVGGLVAQRGRGQLADGDRLVHPGLPWLGRLRDPGGDELAPFLDFVYPVGFADLRDSPNRRHPLHLHKRILLTHDLGAIATLGILYLAMGPTEFAANPGGEALILGIVYPVVGTIAWRKFLEFSSR